MRMWLTSLRGGVLSHRRPLRGEGLGKATGTNADPGRPREDDTRRRRETAGRLQETEYSRSADTPARHCWRMLPRELLNRIGRRRHARSRSHVRRPKQNSASESAPSSFISRKRRAVDNSCSTLAVERRNLDEDGPESQRPGARFPANQTELAFPTWELTPDGTRARAEGQRGGTSRKTATQALRAVDHQRLPQ